MRRVLVLHEDKDWEAVVQSLLDSDSWRFPYSEVTHKGTERLVSLPESWKFDEVITEDLRMVWCKGYGTPARDVLSEENPSLYCSFFDAVEINKI